MSNDADWKVCLVDVRDKYRDSTSVFCTLDVVCQALHIHRPRRVQQPTYPEQYGIPQLVHTNKCELLLTCC